MIEARALSKRYGRIVAIDDLSFAVRPGLVTGFLGPNGAGKSTTMRLALGLDRATGGEILLDGRRYGSIAHPRRHVGALLEATAIDGGRTAFDHLRWIARSQGIADRRIAEVLELVGLAALARRRVATMSLGMKQRLGLAAALLGDPSILLLDEPGNGLDPEGVRWLRELLRSLAAEGRTVFVSSHLMSEMALTAERLVIIARGRLVADELLQDLGRRFDGFVRVRGERPAELARALELAGARVTFEPDGALHVAAIDSGRIGQVAAVLGIPLSELGSRQATLEEAYLRLIGSAAEDGTLDAGARHA